MSAPWQHRLWEEDAQTALRITPSRVAIWLIANRFFWLAAGVVAGAAITEFFA